MDTPERQGQPIFADELLRFAAATPDARVAVIAEQLSTPLRIWAHGRPGVGTTTAIRALCCAGLAVSGERSRADLEVRVIAEVAKPEDLAGAAGRGRLRLTVLTKADLAGFGAGGPLAAARRRCDRLQTLSGTPVLPLAALLAVAGRDEAVLDDTLLRALRTLVTMPADLRTTDGFVAGEHLLDRAVRSRLLRHLDLFGIAHAVAALRQPGAGPASVRAALIAHSAVDELVAGIEGLGAEVRYRRTLHAVADLETLSVTADRQLSQRISSFLCADDTVVARMADAAAVLTSAGMTVDAAEDRSGHLRQAARWSRYGRGPVTPLHGACGADIARGALRLIGGGG